MPTMASGTVIGHLYREPKSGATKDGKTWARFSLWTSDRVKPTGGDEYEKKFSSWGGICNGPQADWLIRDGKKGSLVAVTGTIRIDSHTDDKGKVHATGEFVRVQEIRVLDARDDDKAEPTAAPAPKRPAAPAGGSNPDEEPPFMSKGEWE
jgi:single-stranded DNA-binding protein